MEQIADWFEVKNRYLLVRTEEKHGHCLDGGLNLMPLNQVWNSLHDSDVNLTLKMEAAGSSEVSNLPEGERNLHQV